MSSNGDEGRDRLRRLMMAALDGEVTRSERRELECGLEGDPELREEWERMGRVKEVTSGMALREPPEEVWGHYWTSVYNRAERGLGWILVSIGVIVIGAYGAWTFVEEVLADSGTPWPLRLGILAAVVGGIVLAVSVFREKWTIWRKDPYREIER